jgi:GT2 family glycosyltransferase
VRPGPAIGVVVITRNRRDRLATTLRRLCALPGGPPVVVVDNASTDGTAEAVRDGFPEARLLVLPRNRAAAGRNDGVALLDTPYVAFSDDDSWWAPEALDAAARIFDGHPRLGLLAAATLVGPQEHPDPLNAQLAASPLGREPDLPGPSVLGFLACACVVRRRAFLRAGGFHPLLQLGGEEELLALDLAAADWGVAYCPQVVAHHHPDGTGPRPGRRARLRRNALLVAVMRRPWRVVARAAVRLAREAVGSREGARALASAVFRLPAATRARRLLPPHAEQAARLLDRSAAPSPRRSRAEALAREIRGRRSW